MHGAALCLLQARTRSLAGARRLAGGGPKPAWLLGGACPVPACPVPACPMPAYRPCPMLAWHLFCTCISPILLLVRQEPRGCLKHARWADASNMHTSWFALLFHTSAPSSQLVVDAADIRHQTSAAADLCVARCLTVMTNNMMVACACKAGLQRAGIQNQAVRGGLVGCEGGLVRCSALACIVLHPVPY